MREEYRKVDNLDTSGGNIKSFVVDNHSDKSNIQKFQCKRSQIEPNKNVRYKITPRGGEPLTIPWYLLDQVRGEKEQFIQEKVLARINPQKSTLFQ